MCGSLSDNLKRILAVIRFLILFLYSEPYSLVIFLLYGRKIGAWNSGNPAIKMSVDFVLIHEDHMPSGVWPTFTGCRGNGVRCVSPSTPIDQTV